MMEHGTYDRSAEAGQHQTRSVATQEGNDPQIRLTSLKAFSQNGEGVIESSERIRKLQVFTVTGQLIVEKQDVVAPVYFPLSDGVNVIKVQTENETEIFKLIK